jgi:hypothetical protein
MMKVAAATALSLKPTLYPAARTVTLLVSVSGEV